MGTAVNVISSKSVKNYCINGQFDFFQRRAVPSWVNEGNLYTADRWFRFKQTGGGTGVFTNIQDSGLGNGTRSIKIGRPSGSTDVNGTEIIQALESKDSYDLAGKKVTFSFKVRKGANFSGSQVNFYIGTGTGTDQGVVAAWTGAQTFNGTSIPTASLSTSTYYQASMTLTLPSGISQVRFDINYIPTGTAGANDWIEITEVMLNEGDFTPYVRHAESWINELVVCQRYFEKSYDDGASPGAFPTLNGAHCWHGVGTANRPFTTFYFKVQKRTTPNTTFYNPNTGSTSTPVYDSQTATNFGIASQNISQNSGWLTPSGTPATNGSLFIHWAADAEL